MINWFDLWPWRLVVPAHNIASIHVKLMLDLGVFWYGLVCWVRLRVVELAAVTKPGGVYLNNWATFCERFCTFTSCRRLCLSSRLFRHTCSRSHDPPHNLCRLVSSYSTITRFAIQHRLRCISGQHTWFCPRVNGSTSSVFSICNVQ